MRPTVRSHPEPEPDPDPDPDPNLGEKMMPYATDSALSLTSDSSHSSRAVDRGLTRTRVRLATPREPSRRRRMADTRATRSLRTCAVMRSSCALLRTRPDDRAGHGAQRAHLEHRPRTDALRPRRHRRAQPDGRSRPTAHTVHALSTAFHMVSSHCILIVACALRVV
jgi:hypothetical protein